MPFVYQPQQQPLKVQKQYSHEAPVENQNVYLADKRMIRLGKPIAPGGGEGVVYETNTLYVAKIYHANVNNDLRERKIKFMVENQIKMNGVC